MNHIDLNSCANNSNTILNTFYTDVLCSFYKCRTNKNIKNMSYHDIVAQPIWLNKAFTYKDKCLFFKEWIDAGILFIKDVVNSEGQIMTELELENKIGRNCNFMHQLFIFKNSSIKKLQSLDLSIAPFVKIRNYDKVLIDRELYDVQNLNTKLLYSIISII